VNIFDLWGDAVARFESGYGDKPDVSDVADLTVVLGLLGEAVQEALAEEDGRIASMFDDAARRLAAGEDAPPFDGEDAHLDLHERLDRVNAGIFQLQREVRELRGSR
jgi:hypothetical protein